MEVEGGGCYNAPQPELLGGMELIRGVHNLRHRHRGCAATIGAFDGVHFGHRAVLEQLLGWAGAAGLPSAVIVFEPLPREYLRPRRAPARLTSFREKFRALEEFGIDRLLRIRFDGAVRGMSAGNFVRRIFAEGLGARCVVVGDDFRFGRNREGGFAFMEEQGARYGFEVLPTATVALAGGRVSSTRIRDALAAADFALAEQLLGRPYRIGGKVVYGERRGRGLGAPTANLELRRPKAALSGVYIVEVSGAGTFNAGGDGNGAGDSGGAAMDVERWPGVANVGTRPTFGDGCRANLEVHLLGFEGSLYGKMLEVTFLEKIRDERRFESPQALQRQIREDIAQARAHFVNDRL